MCVVYRAMGLLSISDSVGKETRTHPVNPRGVTARSFRGLDFGMRRQRRKRRASEPSGEQEKTLPTAVAADSAFPTHAMD